MKGASFGAVTILNAVLCGKGAAFGVNLKTEAEFELHGNKEIAITNDPFEDTDMARICVHNTFRALGKNEPNEWSLSVTSDIPISKGMKSSSSACNAIILAVLNTMSCELSNNELMKLSVKCARESGVTVTGALDDASACHFGGLMLSDNNMDAITQRNDIPDVDVMFCIPDRKIRKYVPDIPASVTDDAEKLFTMSSKDPWTVMTENGKLISTILNVDNSIAEIAIKHGALAAGVTGFGPTVAIVIEKEDRTRFLKESNISPDIITTSRRPLL